MAGGAEAPPPSGARGTGAAIPPVPCALVNAVPSATGAAAEFGRDDLPLRFDALLVSGDRGAHRLEHLQGIG